ncbi:hypothetical protein Ancab_002334 [Ancistrocladus abbreviatus]
MMPLTKVEEGGKDRDRVYSQPIVEKSTHSDSENGGDELSVVPCSLSGSMGNQRKVSMENSSSHDNKEAPISSETNDDKCCKKLGLGKNHYTEKDGRILGKRWTEENSNYGCVSSSGKFFGWSIYGEETALIKRREEEDFLANTNSPIVQITDSKTTVGLGKEGVGADMPTYLGNKKIE